MNTDNDQNQDQDKDKDKDKEHLPPAQPAPRSEGLLPAGEDDVAEEISLDQQSDQARRVGHAPADGPGKPADALAETLKR